MSGIDVSTPKVTVGIPTFNRARWLREAIDSVLAQTYTDFRLIVSDNASDDDTPDVVRSLNDKRITFVRSERNAGASGNLNRLIELAETEFLVLLPDDDVLYPGHLEAAVKLLERFETVGLAHSAFDYIDARSRLIRRVHPVVSRSLVKVRRSDLALEWLMVSPEALCFSSVAYRTKALIEAGGFREDEGPFRDRQTWMRIALDWDFGYIAKSLVGQRTHPGTLTTTTAAENGATSAHDHFLVRSQMNFQRRIAFLDDAPLDSWRTKRLRALATLQLLADRAAVLPWSEVAARLAVLVETYPRIVLRPALWRLVAAQLGGRQVRSVLQEALSRTVALGRAE